MKRPSCTSTAQRLDFAPELPTLKEQGINVELLGWFAAMVPMGTPKPIVAKLNAEANRALKSPELIEQFRIQGYEPLGGTPDDMKMQIKTDVAQWTRIIRDAAIEPQ